MIRQILKKWRGLHARRYLKGPLSLREYVFAKEWEKLNEKTRVTMPDHLCREDSSAFIPECSDRDRIITNTVIQWLGTNCGQAFLHTVTDSIEEVKKKGIDARRKICPNKMRCLTQKEDACLCKFSDALF